MADWETVGKSTDGWEDAGGWETVSPKKSFMEQDGFFPETARTLDNAARGISDLVVTAPNMLLGGIQGALGFEDARDSTFKRMEDTQAMLHEGEVKNKTLVGGAASGAAPVLASLPLGGAGIATMLTAGFGKQGQGLVQQGVDPTTANVVSGIDTAGNLAGALVPGGRLIQSVANPIAGAATDWVNQHVLKDSGYDKVAEQYDPLNLERRLTDVMTGAAMPPPAKGNKANTTPENKYSDYKPESKEEPYSLRTDIARQADVLRTNKAGIEDALARQTDPNSEQSHALREELRQTENSLIKLETELGATEHSVGTTGATRDVDTTQMFNPYGYDNQHGNRSVDVEADAKMQQLADGVTPEQMAQTQWIHEQQQKQFEPLGDRQSVNDSVLSRDLSTVSTPVLENMLRNKEQKIRNAKDPEFAALLKQEYDYINSHLEQRIPKDVHDVSWNKDYDPIALRDEGLTDMVMRGDIRGALDRVVQMGKGAEATDVTRALSKIAETLLGNQNVGLGKYALDPTMQHPASYSNKTGDTTFRGSKDITPINVVHEAIHSAVNKALQLFKEGKLTNFVQIQAARVLTDLHTRLNGDEKFKAALDAAVGEKSRGIFLENVREMVAYGTTHPEFQKVLHNYKLGSESLYSKLGNAVKNILGFKGAERSAFDELMKYSEKLIDLSDGKAHGEGGVSFAKLHTAQGIRDAIQSGSLKVFAHGFTSQMRQMMRNNPHFSAISKMVADVEWTREARDINILMGKDENRGGEGLLFRLRGPESETAIVPSMYNMKNKDISGIFDLLADGYRKGVTIDETLAKNPNLPEHQVRLAKALQEGYRKLAEAVWRMYGTTQLPQRLAERLGYLLTTRTGPHQVHLSFMGIPLRMESYLTKAEANHREQWFRERVGDRAKVEVLFSEDADANVRSITELMESLLKTPQDQIHEVLQKQLESLEVNNADIQGHQKHSSILSGFTGDQAGMSAERRGELLREAIPRSIKQYSQAIATREINKNLIDYLIDNEHRMDKTTKELVKFYVETQTVLENPKNSGAYYIKGGSRVFREMIDTVVDGMFGFDFRDKHALDRFTGLFQNIFSTFNITMKPAIWIAQPLQALNSMRSAFKEGESPRQVAQAMGQTMLMLAKGAKNADPEFLAHLQKVAEEHNTLHPQMMNEFNDFKFGTNPNSWPNFITDVVTGKRISAGGDKFSRFASFAFFWNLHKQSGLKGQELYKTAARDATENMVAYGKKSLPAIYRETGLFGEQASPLATFSHAYLGNMIVDIKEFIAKPNARTLAPVMITGALATIMGGAISAPLIAEYELLRLAGIKMGWWGATTLPSVRNLINTHAPEAISHGVLSAVTGVDMDASMRYTSLLQKIGDVETAGWTALFPHLAWGEDFLKASPTLLKAGLGGEVSKRDVDMAFKKTLPKGWPSGAVDAARHDGDLFTKMKDGSALEPRRTAEALAPWFGSRSTKEAEAMDKHIYKQQMDKDKKLMLDSAVQAFTNGYKEKFAKIVKRLVKDHTFSDGDAVVNAIIADTEAQYVPILLRDYAGKTGNMSKAQQEAFVRDEMATFLRKHMQ